MQTITWTYRSHRDYHDSRRITPGFFQCSPGTHKSCGSHQILTVMVTNVVCILQHFKAYIVLSCIRPVHYWNSLYVQDRPGNAAGTERHQFTFNNMLIPRGRPHQWNGWLWTWSPWIFNRRRSVRMFLKHPGCRSRFAGSVKIQSGSSGVNPRVVPAPSRCSRWDDDISVPISHRTSQRLFIIGASS